MHGKFNTAQFTLLHKGLYSAWCDEIDACTCCSLTDTLELEEVGVNESVLIGLHEEVLEMMETESTSDSAGTTVLPFCTCSARSTCQTRRCPCKASSHGCHPTRCKCSQRRCKNQMAEVSMDAWNTCTSTIFILLSNRHL